MQKIFVGDVQGCGDEFASLIQRVRDTFGRDFELWSVGDLINRGPKNLLALHSMRELCDDGRGRVVLGNHEIGLLRIWLELTAIDPKNTYPEILDDPSCPGWIEWLRNRPLGLTGAIGDTRFAMVHASVHPDWSLEDLESNARRVEARLSSPDLDEVRALLRPDLETSDTRLIEDREILGRLTRCRSVDAQNHWSSAQPDGGSRAWHAAWSDRKHDFGVVYGHWAMQGLHIAPGLRGLDTGCVHHGRGRDGFLTAWLPTGDRGRDAFDVPDDRFWQIPALRRYYEG